MRKKYVIAGAGHRALHMFALPLVRRFQDVAELAGIYDINAKRAKTMSDMCGGVPVYEDFEEMLASSGADAVIVTTIDSVHHEYIIRALRAGCDAITEKPMTTDEEKCRAILEAERETGRKVIVTFNVRYIPYVGRVKELIRGGAVGKVLSVHLEYMLDTSHGADYFRRWHRHQEYGGGLLVHKSTHHFDMVNWWLEDEPSTVHAYGDTVFYGPTREERGERCLTCGHRTDCDFYFDVTADEELRRLYVDNEDEDGYYRDRCVFGDGITTYDTMAVQVRYQGGALLSYSLNAFCPYEGWKVSVNGTEGRLEAESYEHALNADSANDVIRVFNRRGEAVVYHLPQVQGVHGGGDERLQSSLFVGGEADPLGKQAGSWEGAQSILIGIAANRSISSGRPVDVPALLQAGGV